MPDRMPRVVKVSLAPKGGVHIRFVPLFEPLADMILAHQNKAVLRTA